MIYPVATDRETVGCMCRREAKRRVSCSEEANRSMGAVAVMS
jgi:hypothetical protein